MTLSAAKHKTVKPERENNITVLAVTPQSGLNDFITVPHRLYKHDPYQVHRPVSEMRKHLSSKNPYISKISIRYFVAYRDGKPVGRISTQYRPTQSEGHFGFLDGDSPDTLEALLEAAETWLQEQGVSNIAGPYSLSINDEAGLLVDGFESRPRLLMNYAPRWYKEALETAGYKKAKDLIAYEIDTTTPLPRAARRMAEQTAAMNSVSERPLDMQRFYEDLSLVTDIFNDAWADNWGFIPLEDDDVRYMAQNMKPVLVPEMARLAFVDDEPAAMIIALPDVNEALHGLNGRLFPVNWLKLLWRLKVRGVTSARVLLMGICKQYSGTPLSAGLAALLIQRLKQAAESKSYEHVELSWVLEDNTATDRLIRMAGGHPYKRYRIYSKDIAS